jgi:DNA-binding MarR family transcriptional regulator/predicted transcriptional regulator
MACDKSRKSLSLRDRPRSSTAEQWITWPRRAARARIAGSSDARTRDRRKTWDDPSKRSAAFDQVAQGHVRFADPENPFWFVSRANDKTSLLSRDEERVLSVIPRDYATDASKIRLASGASEGEVHRALERLLVRRFIEVSDGPWEKRIYRITGAGLKHPQYARSARCAQALRLPVESDRIRNVLSIIMNSGEVRIKEVTNALSLPPRSMNALMQYLKRRHLVKKSGRAPNSPYSLTAEGLATLAEMTRRQAA